MRKLSRGKNTGTSTGCALSLGTRRHVSVHSPATVPPCAGGAKAEFSWCVVVVRRNVVPWLRWVGWQLLDNRMTRACHYIGRAVL